MITITRTFKVKDYFDKLNQTSDGLRKYVRVSLFCLDEDTGESFTIKFNTNQDKQVLENLEKLIKDNEIITMDLKEVSGTYNNFSYIYYEENSTPSFKKLNELGLKKRERGNSFIEIDE